MTEALKVTQGDLKGPVLTKFGALHRKQMNRIFATQGAAGGGGLWAALSPPYAKKKARHFPGRKILQLSGDLKASFTVRGNPYYVQRFIPRGSGGSFGFGSTHPEAAPHYYGNPALARSPSTPQARSIFGRIARRLPKRDMITKTAEMLAEFTTEFKSWYASRVKQVLRGRDRKSVV